MASSKLQLAPKPLRLHTVCPVESRAHHRPRHATKHENPLPGTMKCHDSHQHPSLRAASRIGGTVFHEDSENHGPEARFLAPGRPSQKMPKMSFFTKKENVKTLQFFLLANSSGRLGAPTPPRAPRADRFYTSGRPLPGGPRNSTDALVNCRPGPARS